MIFPLYIYNIYLALFGVMKIHKILKLFALINGGWWMVVPLPARQEYQTRIRDKFRQHLLKR